jgi:2-isopropylmalate synthase
VANLRPADHEPYVGRSAFAHKAGLHVNALMKATIAYQHVDPALVGNKMRVLVSELAGRSNIVHKLASWTMEVELDADEVRRIAERLKELESQGFQYEGAEGSFELLVRRSQPDYRAPFEVLDFWCWWKSAPRTASRRGHRQGAGQWRDHAHRRGGGWPGERPGPGHAQGAAPLLPELDRVQLTDYKVRILDPQVGHRRPDAGAHRCQRRRELLDDGGCSVNIIEASLRRCSIASSCRYCGGPPPEAEAPLRAAAPSAWRSAEDTDGGHAGSHSRSEIQEDLAMERIVIVFDTTLRDGEQSPGATLIPTKRSRSPGSWPAWA